MDALLDGFDAAGSLAVWSGVVVGLAALVAWRTPRLAAQFVVASLAAETTGALEVKAGDLIGYVGNTGRSFGCHLHWNVEFEGRYQNPRPFL